MSETQTADESDRVETEPVPADPVPADPVPAGSVWWTWPSVAIIAVGAGVLYGWGINHGTLHLYYAVAVQSMSTNWHAFAFGGFDPGGHLTLDKLPGSFWVQALVVRVFGLHTWCLIAPQVAAGVGVVVMMFVTVRRVAGARAGLVAALVVAVTPATAVMSRGNTPDAICVLLMVVAADTALRALRTGRLRSLIVAGIWIGVAFQAKMIEAWAILPALGLAYLIAAPGSLRQRFRRCAVAGAVAIAVSLSWMTAITLIPATDRPYVDGSQHDSVFSQVFEYNALGRFGSVDTVYGLASDGPAGNAGISTGVSPPPYGTRLVSGGFGRDAGWLLPLALFCVIALLIALRRRPRTDFVRAAVVVWGGWLVVFTVALSFSTEILSYYTGVLAPPIAALVALGLQQLVRALRAAAAARRAGSAPSRAPSVVLLLAAVVSVGALPALADHHTPHAFDDGIAVIAVITFFVALLGIRLRVRAVAIAFALLLVAPTAAGIYLDAEHGGAYDVPFAPTLASTLATPGLATYRGVVVPQADTAFWSSVHTLGENSQNLDDRHRLLIPSAATASVYLLAGLPGIEVVGGYTGLIDDPSAAEIRAEVDRHEIMYALVPGADDPRFNDPQLLVIKQACHVVQGLTSDADGPSIYMCN